MVSTFLSYDMINRDMKSSLARVAGQGMIERQTNYYKENIGKVTSIDEFLDDYQLYSYAMDAFGLEEMTYAKAFMRKVLESDLNDENSFANKLTDERYRTFAEAFNFSSSTVSVQTEAQLDAMIGLYGQTLNDQDASLAEETRYFKSMMATVSNVDQVLQNSRLRAYVFKVFSVDEKTFSYSYIRGLMTSDVNDPNSYINQQYGAAYADAVDRLTTKGNIDLHGQVTARLSAIETQLADPNLDAGIRTLLEEERTDRLGDITALEAVLPPKAEWETTLAAINAEASKLRAVISQYNRMALMADAFEFANDGTVAAGGAITDGNLKAVTDSFIGSSVRVTPTVAKLNREYYESKIGSITSVDQLMADSRLVRYIRTAFELTGVTVVDATIKNILTSDLDDPDNYIATFGKNNEAYLALRKAFNFTSDGTLPADTPAQDATQLAKTNSGYNRHYDDKDVEADAKALKAFKSSIIGVKSVNDFLSNNSVYNYALNAVGLDRMSVDIRTVRAALTSDLQDPKSAVYRLGDERFVKLAELFNFKSDGALAAPLLAQSQIDLQNISVAYIKGKSVFGTEADKDAAKKESEYYGAQIQKIKSLDALLKDTRVLNFAMEALGLDPDSVTSDDLRRMFTSDLDDKDSFLNQNFDSSWRKLVTSFNFNPDGSMLREDRDTVQTRRGFHETIDKFIRQTMEVQAGDENAGVRLALYFNRMATSVTSYYTILSDSAIQQFINTAFGIPGELGNAAIDTQVGMMKKYFEIQDFQDPEKVKKLIARFTVLFDNDKGSTDPIMMLFDGSGSFGISADTLLAATSYRSF